MDLKFSQNRYNMNFKMFLLFKITLNGSLKVILSCNTINHNIISYSYRNK